MIRKERPSASGMRLDRAERAVCMDPPEERAESVGNAGECLVISAFS
jgi:hypothetical protein